MNTPRGQPEEKIQPSSVSSALSQDGKMENEPVPWKFAQPVFPQYIQLQAAPVTPHI
jgi:hypothetical protein